MIASIGWGTFLIFAIANALFIPVIWVFYPETKGRTLEAIDLSESCPVASLRCFLLPFPLTFFLPSSPQSSRPPSRRRSDPLTVSSLKHHLLGKTERRQTDSLSLSSSSSSYSSPVAQRMPSMTDAEVEHLTKKIDIHGHRGNGTDQEKAIDSATTPDSSSNPVTRVQSPTFGDVVGADKGPR